MAKVKGEIVVDIERCKGCEVCLEFCPTNTIAMVDAVNSKGYRYMQNIHDACTGCTNCAIVCPDGVITVYRVKVETQKVESL
jgi:2-oxoglutarate ferredoxin oxidoreductase subunit delta